LVLFTLTLIYFLVRFVIKDIKAHYHYDKLHTNLFLFSVIVCYFMLFETVSKTFYTFAFMKKIEDKLKSLPDQKKAAEIAKKLKSHTKTGTVTK